jgi:hypothetical protein
MRRLTKILSTSIIWAGLVGLAALPSISLISWTEFMKGVRERKLQEYIEHTYQTGHEQHAALSEDLGDYNNYIDANPVTL